MGGGGRDGRDPAGPAKPDRAAPKHDSLVTIASLSVLAFGALVLAMTVGTSGCTSMGFDHPALRDSMDFGRPEQVRMCIYLDDGITQDEATQLLSSWDAEAPIYNLYLTPVSFQHMKRWGYFHGAILDQVRAIPLSGSCDRVLYFVNRNLGDVAWGIASLATGFPEILGEVDDLTLTHGFVVARVGSLNQAIMTPASVTQHELFHLMGCAEHFDMPDCYRRIQSLKRVETKLADRGYYEQQGETAFYPTFASLSDGMLLSRAQVDQYAGEQNTSVAAAAAP